jgi:hypothetical protein
MICTGMHCWHRFQPMLTPHAGKINCNSFSLRPSTRFTTIPAALNLMRKDCSSYVCIQELLGRGAGASKKGDGAAMVISFLQKDVAAAKARMLVLQTGVHARIFKELNSLIFPFQIWAIMCRRICAALCRERESRGHEQGKCFVCDRRCAGMHVSAHFCLAFSKPLNMLSSHPSTCRGSCGHRTSTTSC